MNISYTWRHNGDIIRNKANTLELPTTAAGSYTCEASNNEGTGPACDLKLSGKPVAQFVAETDYTYLAFGVSGVVAVFVFVLAGIIACRRAQIGGYDLARAFPYYGGPNGHNGDHNGQVNHVIQNENGTKALYASSAGNIRKAPPTPIVPEDDAFDSMGNYNIDPTSLKTASIVKNGTASRKLMNGHHNGNGYVPHSEELERAKVTKKRVTVNPERTSIEFDDEGEETEVEDSRCPPPNDRMVLMQPRTKVLNAFTRTCELGNVRAPKELWLV